MRIFSAFSGIGGFEIGIQKAFEGWERQGVRGARSIQHIPPGRNMADISEQSWNRPICVGYSEIDKYAIKVYEKQFGGKCENCRLARERERNSGASGRQETVDSERTRLSQADRDNDNTKNERSKSDRTTCKHAPKNYGDITKINAEELPDFDCLVGGFPCQAFSIAGKRKGFEDTRGTLFFDLARILRAKQPRLFVFENVKGLLSHDSGRTFKTIIQTIDELGYDCQWQVLNSKNFGVSQNRERVYIVGHLRGTPRPEVFPIGFDTEQTDTTVKRKRITTGRTRNFGSSAQLHAPDEICSTMTTSMGTGGNNVPCILPVLTPDRLNKRQNGRRFKEDGEPAFTVNTQDRHGIYDGMKIRRLTPVECERLQGFPDGWTAQGADGAISDTQRYKMCGNAVTTNVVQAVFEKIFESTMEANQ